jgi:ATP-dependent Clp protease ATP-binding subunit ClpC
VFFARHEASQCGCSEIEPEHLLLGILHEDAQLVGRLSLSPANLEAIQARVRKAFEGKTKTSTSSDLPMSSALKKALILAADEAHGLKQGHIGPEHLLFGISRDESALAAAILRDYGFGSFRLRQEAIQRAAESLLSKRPERLPMSSPFRDLVSEAENGAFGPLVGREREVERIVHILSRRAKHNAVLIGEAGVGKTAIVEGLAQRMAQGSGPPFLEQRRLLALDASSLLTASRRGASRGELEDALSNLPVPANTILFVRGLFNLAEAGPAWSVVEAMHALEPQLTRYGLQCIATGSPSGLRATLEKASNLAGHFEVVPVAPVNEEDAIGIVFSLKPRFERFHEVTFGDGAIETAVYASGCFPAGRHLPDRAIDLIDEAAAAVRLRRESESREVVEIRTRIRQHLRAVEKAIENHEFEAARRYSEEERKERENLQQLRNEKPADAAPRIVTPKDIAAAVAARTGVTVAAVERVLDTRGTGELQRTASELSANLPADSDWVPLLAEYLVRCSAEEAEALAKAIRSAKAKLIGLQSGQGPGGKAGPSAEGPPSE